MFSNLSQREKIMIYILFAMIAVYVLYKYVWAAQITMYDQVSIEHQMLDKQVTEYKNSVLTLEDLKGEQHELQNKLVEVTTPFNIDVMGGEYVREIGEKLESAGLKVEQAVPMNINAQQDYYTQDVRFLVQGNYGALEQFFFDTEYAPHAFMIKRFDILPDVTEGTDISLAGLNYNNLNADIIISVIGDKAAKVSKPNLQTFKIDIFKPNDKDMQAMKDKQSEIEAAALEAQAEENTDPNAEQPNADNLPAPDVSLEDPPAADNQPEQEYQVPETKQQQEYKLNYSFEKR